MRQEIDIEIDRAALTAVAAERGIYLDAQGVRGNPPVVVGILVEEHLDQVIFDTDFADAALAKELRINSMESEMRSLLQLAREEERFVFGFSPGCLDMAGPAEVDELRRLFVDGQQLGTAWRRRESSTNRGSSSCRRSGSSRRSDLNLGDLLRMSGASCPSGLDGKTTSKRLRDVRAMMRSRGSYEAMTAVGKGKWTNLLKQNRARCEGLRTLMLAVVD
jgi:hypothetical protein